MSSPVTPALRDTLAVFEQPQPGTPLTTTEVATELDSGRRSTFDKLERLADAGHLCTKSVGARGRIWWRPAERPDGLTHDVSFRSLVSAVHEYAIFLLSPDGRVATWNAGAERIKGYGRDEILGEPLETFYTDEDVADGVVEDNLATAAAEGRFEQEGWRVRGDGSRFWAIVTITAIRDDDGSLVGYAKVTRDMTEQRRYERRLRRQRDRLESEVDELYERIDDAFFALDDAGRFVHLNEQASALVGRSAGELLGTTIWETLPELAEGTPGRRIAEAMASQESTEFEFRSERLDGWIEGRMYPSESGLSMSLRDVTERKERERRLERYEMITETVSDGIYTVDDDGLFTMVNSSYCEMVGYDREELLGSHVSLLVDEETIETARGYDEKLRSGDRETARFEADIETGDGESIRLEATFAVTTDDDGSPAERVGVVRDVTERVERERALERYRTIVETVDDGIYVLDDEYEFVEVNDAYVDITGYDREELLGTPCSLVVGEDLSSRAAERSRSMATGDERSARIEAPIHRADGTELLAESKFTPLTDETGSFEGTVGVVRDMSERIRRERMLERQRRQLADLDGLNGLARAVTRSVIEQSTRAEVERAVCAVIADSESYDLAWIGAVDSASGMVSPHVGSPAASPPDNLPIVADTLTAGPVGRAIETGAMQVTDDVASVAPPDGWDDLADEVTLESAAAIPVAHEKTVYGVLCVYTGREEAFSVAECDVIAGLGEVVGQAIAAIERKRALMSDEVVELEFRLADLDTELGVPPPVEGRVEFGQAIPLGDDEFLVYGTADDAGVELVEAAETVLDHWDEVECFEPENDRVRLQVRLTEPPLSASVAAFGGRVRGVVFADGGVHITIHAEPGARVRQVIDLIRTKYPDTELVRRRQFSRSAETASQPGDDVLDALTDRQRTVLLTAYNCGFFDQPRLHSGAEVADTLDISAATFHQHLRVALQKMTGSVLSGAS